ncbi:hypothetical protein EXIGLDRAFT_165878 [Exidia glandulosa HHB12029]|uniref:Uncharacterized protein n=1 Tax=Exidia glandulosa HHB12029 TaxID=1314781 RepID=A0A165N4M4_EXIGL|nr:hypothetical protein EXIGLDRAFT_165878 [Exidia glandulosa HHB12029]
MQKTPSLRMKLQYAAHARGPFFSSGGPRKSRSVPQGNQVHFPSGLKPSTAAPMPHLHHGHQQQMPTSPMPEVSVFDVDSLADEDAGKDAPPVSIPPFYIPLPSPRPPCSRYLCTSSDLVPATNADATACNGATGPHRGVLALVLRARSPAPQQSPADVCCIHAQTLRICRVREEAQQASSAPLTADQEEPRGRRGPALQGCPGRVEAGRRVLFDEGPARPHGQRCKRLV